MGTPLETIGLALLLVVLLSYRKRVRGHLGIRNIRLPTWCPEPTLTCISYSSTRPISFTWITCVSLSAEEERRRLPLRGLPRPQPQLRPRLHLRQLRQPRLPQRRHSHLRLQLPLRL